VRWSTGKWPGTWWHEVPSASAALPSIVPDTKYMYERKNHFSSHLELSLKVDTTCIFFRSCEVTQACDHTTLLLHLDETFTMYIWTLTFSLIGMNNL
jgi:hypothetical protein